MDKIKNCLIFLHLLILFNVCDFQRIPLNTPDDKNEEVDLRKEMDQITQNLITTNDPDYRFYHSYIFNSGIGNREGLQVETLERNSQFSAGEGVTSWQSVQSAGLVYLLGRQLKALTLITTSSQLSSNRSAHFYEYTLEVGANVASTTLLSRWNPVNSKQEIIAIVAVDTLSADILWYRVTQYKLEYIKSWARYTKTSSVAAVNVGGKSQLVITDTGSPASVDVFDIVFGSDGNSLNFRLVQNFPLDSRCTSVTVFGVGRQRYLAFLLPDHKSVAVYRLHTTANISHFENHSSLVFTGISQIITFTLAHQAYLAINGDNAGVLRLTEEGDFVSELSPGRVSEWLAVSVFSYRSDVVLLSRDVNLTRAFVWAGANRGFSEVTLPECGPCLHGDWLGAVSIQLHHQPCLLLPRTKATSSLITIITSLHEKGNPVMDKLKSITNSIKHHESIWQGIQRKLSEAAEALKHIVKKTGKNIITAKWKLRKLETPTLHLESLVQSKSEVDMLSVPLKAETTDFATLESLVEKAVNASWKLTSDVKHKEEEVWGFNGFTGKVSFKSRLIVDNLTIATLNDYPVNELLQNTFRKNKPATVKGSVTITSLHAENVIINRVNKFTNESLKFTDEPVTIKGNVKFLSSISVNGDVKLSDGGTVNGMDLLRTLCQGKEKCSVVFPVDAGEGNEDLDNTIDKAILDENGLEHHWKIVLGGKNLTVLNVMGLHWNTLISNVVYKDRPQNVSGSVIINGTLESMSAIKAEHVEDYYSPKQRSNTDNLQNPSPIARPAAANRMIERGILPLDHNMDTVFYKLEVTGTVSCDDSEWGASSADIVFRDANPVQITVTKNFTIVNVTNNMEVKGTIAGVNVLDLITTGAQIFNDPIVLQGNVTFGNTTLTGLWNGVNISSDVSGVEKSITSSRHVNELEADEVLVLETLNGVPVPKLVFTDSNGDTTFSQLSVQRLDVKEDVKVAGKVCNESLVDFNKTRLSIHEEQNITGMFVINKTNISKLEVGEINNVGVSTILHNLETPTYTDTIQISALHVEGDITTEHGINGYNLSSIATNAVWLHSNNHIKGHLIFKDEVMFKFLECKGYFNHKPCQDWFGDADVVYKTNGTVIISGKKTFLNPVNIVEDLDLEEINGHKSSDILTKTTKQDIKGDIVVNGGVSVTEELTLLGLLNNQNMTEFTDRCSLTGDTITCKGNAVFKGSVDMEKLNSTGKINGINFDHFTESMVDAFNPQLIHGFKNFTGKTTIVNDLVVSKINDQSWDGFILDSVIHNANEEIMSPVVFTDKVTIDKLSVDFNLNAKPINNVDLDEWRTNAIYINDSYNLKRTLHLRSASSRDNLTVNTYGDVNMDLDLVKLNSKNIMSSLRFKSVHVTENIEIANTVNNQHLGPLERTTLKVSGNQMVTSDFVLMGEMTVTGNVTTSGQVNHNDLKEAIPLVTNQTLEGNYVFECVKIFKNMSAELVSGMNMTDWYESAVLKDSDQEVRGVWEVRGGLELRNVSKGPGRLADTDLAELKRNITRHILDVHQQMKANFSSACDETNHLLDKARNQTSELMYLDVSQQISTPTRPSLVKHFTSEGRNYLAICENSCVTTIYKWDPLNGSFLKLYSEHFGFAVSQLVVLHERNTTYFVTVPSGQTGDCYYTGNHLWLFEQERSKHISSVTEYILSNTLIGLDNKLYSMNATGVFQWYIKFVDGEASFKLKNHWKVNTAGKKFLPETLGVGLALQDSNKIISMHPEFDPELYQLHNYSGEVDSISVDPTHNFIAVAATENAAIPRYSDHVKVYRPNGQLFDKLPASRASHLQWLAVPDQTWLVFLQNHSTIQLYHLQGTLEGFQLKLAAKTEALGLSSVVLPLESKVNHQPYLIVQSMSSVKILRASIQGDPYSGKNMICHFNEGITPTV